ncbi:hypothetical protein ACS04_03405 [Streptomyces roseus]|uniref:DNA primase/polymerase bifunctional N-terminal domain-containing protein n=1 Tax=Streptomyces roseus TaxID=66430 RepID=A0A0J7APT4_9ACTN|nr:hypothetical protein ACS04_03405 [Streptomyces roseus]
MTTLTTAPAYPADAPTPAPHARTATHVTHVTPQGAAWLASASAYPHGTLARWQARAGSPAVLPCGTAFDVVNVPHVLGRRMLDLLWAEGPGSGPVAVHRGRMLLFAATGTAHRLPALLAWVGDPPTKSGGECGSSVPAPLCHGHGDAVTVPPLAATPGPSRWVVAPDTRSPWLPGPEALLWAYLRAARAADIDFSFRPSPC